MPKKITIDTLARMAAEQFTKVDERFDSLEERMDKMENKFEARFDKMDSTLKTILDVVLEIPSKKAFERLENKVDRMDVELAAVQRKIK